MSLPHAISVVGAALGLLASQDVSFALFVGGIEEFFFSTAAFLSLNVSLRPPVFAFLSVERLGKIGVLLNA